jgi:cell division protein ZapA (FtsZ GTPase activity inhibitor)
MESEDKLSIRVNIADRFYPLKIDRKDEEMIRSAAKVINEKILLYKQSYNDKDIQDFLSMAALQFVTKQIEDEHSNKNDSLLDDIEIINAELDEYIKSEEK